MSVRQASFVPGVGVDGLQLGATLEEVKVRLDPSRNFVKSSDEYTWETIDPECVWYFGKSSKGDIRLRQVIADTCDVTIDGVPLSGFALDECLLSLGVKSFNETLWCRENVYLDYKEGEQLADQYRSRDKNIHALLARGTLWIKSKGLGLHMVDGKVASIAIRLPRDVPGVGCGPLTGDDVIIASDPELGRNSLNKTIASQSAPKGIRGVLANPIVQVVLLVCGLASIAIPLYWTYNRYEYWKDAESVQGTVVNVEMKGPFVESLDVMYVTANERKQQVKVPAMKTDARKVGDKVDLWYKRSKPEIAFSTQQIDDEAFETYFIYTFGGVIVAQAFFTLRSFGRTVDPKKQIGLVSKS